MVVAQQAAESFATFDAACYLDDVATWIDQIVVESLIISFCVIVSPKVGERVSK